MGSRQFTFVNKLNQMLIVFKFSEQENHRYDVKSE